MRGDRHLHTIEEIKAFLLARCRDVVTRYAPPAQGSYEDRGQYFTLNPGRADKSVGSFVVWLDGPKMGRWTDFATGQHGDLLDLIALRMSCNIVEALKEARSYLGLVHDTPADAARRKAEADRAVQLSAQVRREAAARRERRRRYAHALWLSGTERIAGTAVEYYLRDRRCIDLAALGRQPRALRYHPSVSYKHVDRETGEVIEGSWPAMLALITNGRGQPVACHRTWLARSPRDGRWDKAPVPKAKKVVGDYAGAAIHLWAGTGPRGGKAGPLHAAPPGQHLFLAEGIEDALSGAVVLPDERFWAAISVSNFAGVTLPDTVTRLTIIADQDEGPEAQAELARAIDIHAAAGREVRVWKNTEGGKDLNDALRRRIEQQRKTEGRDVG